MATNKWLLLFYCFLIISCSSLGPDEKSAKIWFNKNKDIAIELKNKLLANPKIRTVTPGMKLIFEGKYDEFDEEDVKIYESIKSLAKKYKIKSILVLREPRTKEGRALSVRLTLYSVGILGRGEAMSIVYLLDDDILNISKEINLVIPLDEKDWYVTIMK